MRRLDEIREQDSRHTHSAKVPCPVAFLLEELDDTRNRLTKAEDLLSKDPDIDWPEMARLLFAAEARADQAEEDAEMLRRYVAILKDDLARCV